MHEGSNCCILSADAEAKGSTLKNGTMVEEGWRGSINKDGEEISVSCCHGVMCVPLGRLVKYLDLYIFGYSRSYKYDHNHKNSHNYHNNNIYNNYN